MPDHSNAPLKTSNRITFRSFWLLVSQELGQARLYLDAGADNVDSFIQENSDVLTYLHRAIKQTYRGSQCQNLDSPISLECVLDTLGETAYQIQTDHSGDLFDVELLEEIAWLVCDRFADQIAALVERSRAWQHRQRDHVGEAQIISFPEYKIRRANARL